MKFIKKWFFDEEQNVLVDEIIKSLNEEWEQWRINDCSASFGGIYLWIANTPYGDMKIRDRRLPRRRELRRALQQCIWKQARKSLTKNHEDKN